MVKPPANKHTGGKMGAAIGRCSICGRPMLLTEMELGFDYVRCTDCIEKKPLKNWNEVSR